MVEKLRPNIIELNLNYFRNTLILKNINHWP